MSVSVQGKTEVFYVQTDIMETQEWQISCCCHKIDPMSSQNMACVISGHLISPVLLCCKSDHFIQCEHILLSDCHYNFMSALCFYSVVDGGWYC